MTATPTGVVTFEASGQPHCLQFTTNRLCALEEKTSDTILTVAQELALGKDQPLAVSSRTLRALFWAGAGDGSMTLAQAGELIDAIGHHRAVALVSEAFDAAFPQAEEAEPKDGTENPPGVAAG